MTPFEVALTQYGVTEIAGEKDSPEVLKYFKECGWDGDKLKDETAWCSAFVNWCCEKAKYQMSARLNARSWLDVGYQVSSPQVGDIVVYWRESRESWKGHVGFWINTTADHVYTLGGNQSNMVCISPYNKIQLLEYRRLTPA